MKTIDETTDRPPAHGGASSSHRGLHAVLAVSNFAQGLGAFAVIGALASLIQELQVPVHQAGLVVSLYAAVYAVGSPLLVAWSSRIGRRTVLAAGLLVIALGALVGVLAQSFGVLLAGRALMAIGGGLVTPVAGAIGVATSTPHNRGRVLSTVFAGLTIAQALGLPLGAWLVGVSGFRATFVVIAVASIAAAALVWRAVPRQLATTSAGLKALGSVLVEPRLVAALSFIVFFIGGNFVFLTYLTPFLESRYQFHGHALAGVLLLYGLGAVAGNVLGGRMADRLGAVPTLVVLCAVQLLALPALSLLSLAPWIAVALLVVWSVFAWSVHATQQARLVALDTPRAPVLLALHSSGIYIGASAGSAIAGRVLEAYGDRWLGPAGAVLMLLAAASLLLVSVIGRARQPATRAIAGAPS
ncbi:MFS transporter [Caldimonas sp. KR1-144]|uniref:MFS transporter n=1 Tax=Caldimonas sp. KR1-144 TaxID=3400911 RepID=UPI003C0E7C47